MEQFDPEIRFLMSRENGQKAMNHKIIKGVSVTAIIVLAVFIAVLSFRYLSFQPIDLFPFFTISINQYIGTEFLINGIHSLLPLW